MVTLGDISPRCSLYVLPYRTGPQDGSGVNLKRGDPLADLSRSFREWVVSEQDRPHSPSGGSRPDPPVVAKVDLAITASPYEQQPQIFKQVLDP
jgi:hypothetical protein